MNNRRCLTGVHLKGRVVLIDNLPDGINNTNAFFWRPNRTEKIINSDYQDTTYNTNYANDEKIYIPIDEFGNFDYIYDKYVYTLVGAFANNEYIKELHFEEVDGLRNITNFQMLFYDMINVEIINFAAFRDCVISNLLAMFGNCKSLKSIDLSPFTITYKDWGTLSWGNRLFKNCIKLEYLNIGNLYNNIFTHIWYQYANLGRDANNYLVIDNLFNKTIRTGIKDDIEVSIDWKQAFVRNNSQILDFTSIDFSELENIQYRGINLSSAFQKVTAKEIHFPDTKFYIVNCFYTFGSNDSENKPLEYIDFGGATFIRDPNIVIRDKIDYIFTYMNNLKKIRCTQETKDFILEANKTRPLFLPSIFVDNDDAWEIWDK